MAEILADEELLERLREGSAQARARRGRFVGCPVAPSWRERT
jgi:hypothetical protein